MPPTNQGPNLMTEGGIAAVKIAMKKMLQNTCIVLAHIVKITMELSNNHVLDQGKSSCNRLQKCR